MVKCPAQNQADFVNKDVETLCEKLIREMENTFGTDQRRIDHALAVLDYAEQILADQGGDPVVVKAAAILHDIGIQQAERKYNSSAGTYQQIEGPPIAEKILKKYNLDQNTIKRICEIIANHHTPHAIDTPEFRIIWDADQIVNIPSESADLSNKKLQRLINKVFKTNRGRQIASELFLKTT